MIFRGMRFAPAPGAAQAYACGEWVMSAALNADNVDMGTVALLLMLASAAPDCSPQFAPLETGSSSGASNVPFWRKEEAGAWGGAGWLGWTWDNVRLQSVAFVVRDRPRDAPNDDEYVTVQTRPDVTFAVRCLPQLSAGPIASAGIANWSLQSDGPLRVTVGSRDYAVSIQSARSDLTDAQIVLTGEGRRQVLYSAEGFVDEPHFDVVWAGDLDRDGKLDLIVNLHRKYSWHPYRLLLSSLAANGDLVGDGALFETGD